MTAVECNSLREPKSARLRNILPWMRRLPDIEKYSDREKNSKQRAWRPDLHDHSHSNSTAAMNAWCRAAITANLHIAVKTGDCLRKSIHFKFPEISAFF